MNKRPSELTNDELLAGLSNRRIILDNLRPGSSSWTEVSKKHAELNKELNRRGREIRKVKKV